VQFLFKGKRRKGNCEINSEGERRRTRKMAKSFGEVMMMLVACGIFIKWLVFLWWGQGKFMQ